MTVEELKNFLKIDHAEDDTLLQTYINLSEAYVNGAIEIDAEQTIKQDPRYQYAKTLLISHWYENRSATSETEQKEIPFGVVAFLQQLRGA